MTAADRADALARIVGTLEAVADVGPAFGGELVSVNVVRALSDAKALERDAWLDSLDELATS